MKRMMFAMVRTFWKLLAGKRRRFLAASVALIIASCFLYLAPLVPQIVLDGVIATDGQPSRFVSAAVSFLLLTVRNCLLEWTSLKCWFLFPTSLNVF